MASAVYFERLSRASTPSPSASLRVDSVEGESKEPVEWGACSTFGGALGALDARTDDSLGAGFDAREPWAGEGESKQGAGPRGARHPHRVPDEKLGGWLEQLGKKLEERHLAREQVRESPARTTSLDEPTRRRQVPG